MSSRIPAAPSTCWVTTTPPSGQLARVVIKDNLVFDITGSTWEGAGTFAQIGGEPTDITFDHNTVMHSGNIVTFYSGSYINASGARVTGGPIAGFVFTNNLLNHNAYGIFGIGPGVRQPDAQPTTRQAPSCSETSWPATPRVASRYPADNQFPSLAAFNATFRNAAAQDYRLVPGSPYVDAGTDGRNIGCDFTTLSPSLRRAAPTGLRIVQVSRRPSGSTGYLPADPLVVGRRPSRGRTAREPDREWTAPAGSA